MFILNTHNLAILRCNWYLGNDRVLCARWMVEKTAPSTEEVIVSVYSECDQTVTKVYETQTVVECG